VLDYKGNKFSVVDYGAITTQAKTPFPLRLQMIYTDMIGLFDTYHPEVMSMEKLFYNNNAKTVIDVAQARGVITLSAQQKNVPIFEYTPLQVKQSVVGYGRAEKKQVGYGGPLPALAASGADGDFPFERSEHFEAFFGQLDVAGVI